MYIIKYLKTVLLSLLFTFSSNQLNAKCQDLPCLYWKALKLKSLLPIEDYFLTPSQSIKIMSWEEKEENLQLLMLLQESYKDSLMQHFQWLEQELMQNQFRLKKSKMIAYERSYGVHGYYTLHLEHRNRTVEIFISVTDVNGKDVIVNSFPELENKKKNEYKAYTVINNQKYGIWDLRKQEMRTVAKVLEREQPLYFDKEQVRTINLPTSLLFRGVINTTGRYLATFNGQILETKEIVVGFVDMENEQITIVKENRTPHMISADTFDDSKKIVLLEEKHGIDFTNWFLQARQKRKSLNSFIDSLRSEMIARSGAYIEKNGRKQLAGKRNTAIPTQMLFEGGFGEELKMKALEVENTFLLLIKHESEREKLYAQLPIHQEAEKAKLRNQEWGAYKFTNMPLAAILPIFSKIERDFEILESTLLENLLEDE